MTDSEFEYTHTNQHGVAKELKMYYKTQHPAVVNKYYTESLVIVTKQHCGLTYEKQYSNSA